MAPRALRSRNSGVMFGAVPWRRLTPFPARFALSRPTLSVIVFWVFGFGAPPHRWGLYVAPAAWAGFALRPPRGRGCFYYYYTPPRRNVKGRGGLFHFSRFTCRENATAVPFCASLAPRPRKPPLCKRGCPRSGRGDCPAPVYKSAITESGATIPPSRLTPCHPLYTRGAFIGNPPLRYLPEGAFVLRRSTRRSYAFSRGRRWHTKCDG